MIKVHQIGAKHNTEVLDNVSFKVGFGEILAILGPISSGKSLLGRVLAGQMTPQTGSISINHQRLDTQPIRARCQLGYLANPFFLENFLSAYEYLDIIASIYRLGPDERQIKIGQLVEKLDFADEAYAPLERAGSSTRQKVALGAAVIAAPSCLVVDEPIQFLDFGDQQRVIELLRTARQDRSTILITDNLSLAAELADRFLLLENGAVVAEGTLKQLISQTRPRHSNLAGVYEAVFYR